MVNKLKHVLLIAAAALVLGACSNLIKRDSSERGRRTEYDHRSDGSDPITRRNRSRPGSIRTPSRSPAENPGSKMEN